MIRQIQNQLDLGRIALLHDAGGDRSKTVKALPALIESLKKEGYRFVTASELIGKPKECGHRHWVCPGCLFDVFFLPAADQV